jgi:hypothetical protein
VELVMGVILIAVIMFAPRGIAGFITILKQRWQRPSAASAKMEKTS